MKRILKWGGLGVLILVAITVAAVAASGHKTHTAAAVTSPKPTAPAAAAPTCQQQLAAWKSGGGTAQVMKITSALSALGTSYSAYIADMPSPSQQDANALAGNLGTLEGTVVIAQQHMPPACVPRLDTDYGAALTDLGMTDQFITQALGAQNQGNTVSVTANTALANSELTAAQTAISRATADIQSFQG